MVAALDLHRRRDEVKESLGAKRGPAPRYKAPEEYPSLRGRYGPTIDYDGQVVRSCIHCHQIRDAERLLYREKKRPIPDQVLYPWPLPDVLGLDLDPRRRAVAREIEDGSAADRAGFQEGDELVSLEGQPLISIADVQYVLHHAPDEGSLRAKVRRNGKELALEIPLEKGWRKGSDLSWRVSTWQLRRMGTGGLVLEEMSAAERRRAGIPDGSHGRDA